MARMVGPGGYFLIARHLCFPALLPEKAKRWVMGHFANGAHPVYNERTMSAGAEVKMAGKTCSHVAQHLKKVKPSSKGCEDCLKIGGQWVHLRMCLECGHVGCCDSSPHRHARAHFHETQHPLIQSAERGEDWKWCFIDEVYL
jgi:hypothetical protein